MGCDEDEISLDTHIVNDLDADYLDEVEIVMVIEEKYDLEIPDEEAEQLNTVNDVVEYIKIHTKGN